MPCERIEAVGISLSLDLACFLTVPRDRVLRSVGRHLHFVVGLTVLGLAIVNCRGLGRTSAPARVKRISKVIPGMATFDGLLGIPLYLLSEGTIRWATNLLHLIVAVAIIAQASSVATAYDMWEEKEFK
jgi:hypothetical protein